MPLEEPLVSLSGCRVVHLSFTCACTRSFAAACQLFIKKNQYLYGKNTPSTVPCKCFLVVLLFVAGVGIGLMSFCLKWSSHYCSTTWWMVQLDTALNCTAWRIVCILSGLFHTCHFLLTSYLSLRSSSVPHTRYMLFSGWIKNISFKY